MKYVFTAICSLLLTGNMLASDLKPRQTFTTLPKSGQVKEFVGRQADRTAPAKAAAKETEHQWIDLGLCDYVDDIATGYFSVEPVRFKVKVQKDEANEGFYRILDPWANYPYKEVIKNDPDTPGSLGEGDSYYILIDASDPSYVRLLESPLGMDDGDGESSVISLTELVGEFVGYTPLTQADADKAAGRLVDNVISFPVIRSLQYKMALTMPPTAAGHLPSPSRVEVLELTIPSNCRSKRPSVPTKLSTTTSQSQATPTSRPCAMHYSRLRLRVFPKTSAKSALPAISTRQSK